MIHILQYMFSNGKCFDFYQMFTLICSYLYIRQCVSIDYSFDQNVAMSDINPGISIYVCFKGQQLEHFLRIQPPDDGLNLFNISVDIQSSCDQTAFGCCQFVWSIKYNTWRVNVPINTTFLEKNVLLLLYRFQCVQRV